MNTDPIADMLTRIRNAYLAGKALVKIPHSRVKEGVAKVLAEYEFIADYEVEEMKPQKRLRVFLQYDENDQPALEQLVRVSKPGLRKYWKLSDVRPVKGGFGIAILSTSQGVMSGESAKREGTGGEVLAKVW